MTGVVTPLPVGGWTVVYVGPSVNSWWKVIARSGSRVVHRDRLTEAEARSFTPADALEAWRTSPTGGPFQ